MDKLKNLQDLFFHELKDLYSAETQIIEDLPEMVEEAHDSQLKQSFQMHLEQTKNQKKRLEQITQILGINPEGQKCKGIEGLIEEGKNLIDEKANPDTKDAGLIAAVQKIEHYEISAYGTARYYAKMLQQHQVVALLEQTLNEEKATDQKLNDLAINKINRQAQFESTADGAAAM